MSDFISGQRIIEEYKILPFELLNRFIHYGLFPHSPNSGEPVGVNQFLGALFNLQEMADTGHPQFNLCKNFIDKNSAANWTNFHFSGDVTIDQEIAKGLLVHIYKWKEYDDLMVQDMKNRHRHLKAQTAMLEEPKPSERPSKKHKDICQERAKRIWAKYPEMHPAELVTYPSFLIGIRKNNGDQYGEDTLREWISEHWPKRYLGPPKDLNIKSEIIDNWLQSID